MALNDHGFFLPTILEITLLPGSFGVLLWNSNIPFSQTFASAMGSNVRFEI